MTKGKSLRSSHLIVTESASILILINITTVGVTIIFLVLRYLWRRRERLHKATKASLSLCNMIDRGVHQIQLSSECIKASIHTLKLRHNRLEYHTTHRRRRSRCRWSGRGWKSRHLGLWPLWSKLGLTSSNGRAADGTHDREVRRLGKGDRCMVNDPRNSRRENKLPWVIVSL